MKTFKGIYYPDDKAIGKNVILSINEDMIRISIGSMGNLIGSQFGLIGSLLGMKIENDKEKNRNNRENIIRDAYYNNIKSITKTKSKLKGYYLLITMDNDECFSLSIDNILTKKSFENSINDLLNLINSKNEKINIIEKY